jgi:hypothetical protein
MRLALSMTFFTVALFGAVATASAECRVHDNDRSIVIGKFPYDYAYRDCVKAYRNVYLPKFNDGDSELYLRCKGQQQLIAVVRQFKFSATGFDVAGCALPSTMG